MVRESFHLTVSLYLAGGLVVRVISPDCVFVPCRRAGGVRVISPDCVCTLQEGWWCESHFT